MMTNTNKQTVSPAELKLLTLHAAGRSWEAIAENTGDTVNGAMLATYALRKRLHLSPVESMRREARRVLWSMR